MFVAAMNYAANQSESGRPGVSAAALQHRLQQGMHHRAASERVPNGAPPGYGGSTARKNIISAFGQGDSSNWTGGKGLEGHRLGLSLGSSSPSSSFLYDLGTRSG